ncbi:monovalent cation/H(+) antiporter subunit G [Streptomyces sp. NK08204]|uniref:monovalent cation/H(+) antiporter subunit G n=1 Tax=Streptomyces sp. NK08204 TaxID=2873260 RepID=UPI001CED00A2|nr:monovalent cation/H(+) antiporter subunit G [Streptomyces sp. NK08204]
MSGPGHVAALVCEAGGTVVVVASALAALGMRHSFTRLHFLTPATSLGAPLIGAGLVLENGWGLTAGLDILIVALLALSAPVLEAATARVMAQRAGLIGEDSSW